MDEIRALVSKYAEPFKVDISFDKTFFSRFLTITLIGESKSISRSIDMKSDDLFGIDSKSFLLGMIHAMKGEMTSGD